MKMFRKLVIAGFLLIAPMAMLTANDSRYDATDAERARWTMTDLRSWSIALEAYRSDKGHYPIAGDLESVRKAIMPFYVRVAPMTDAWGNEFKWDSNANGTSYRIVSGGADGRFTKASWQDSGASSDFTQDAVIADGSLTRSWEYK